MQSDGDAARLNTMRRILPALLMATAAMAQVPHIGDIDIYGLHKVPAEKVLAALGAHSGDPLPSSKGDVEDRLERVSGVVLGRLEAVCCDGPNAVLFVGIEERGAQHPSFHSSPGGDATLPQELIDTYQNFLVAADKAAAHGNTAEDLSEGHPLLDDPGARAFEERFRAFAAEHFDWLRNVLRNADADDQRAIAAAVICYAPDKQQVAGELQYALQDPDESVRANAARGLTAIAVYASKNPGKDVRLAPTWLVELLNSIVLRDRLEATKTLVTLTDSPNPTALSLIRERGLSSLVEMSRWKTLRYALPPFLLVGRIAGLSDAQIQQEWAKGDREAVISKALAAK
jgi:hypothetical protein